MGKNIYKELNNLFENSDSTENYLHKCQALAIELIENQSENQKRGLYLHKLTETNSKVLQEVEV